MRACNLALLLLGVTSLRVCVGVLVRLAPGLVLDRLPFVWYRFKAEGEFERVEDELAELTGVLSLRTKTGSLDECGDNFGV